MLPKRVKNIIIGLLKESWVNALLQLGEVYMVGGSVRDAFRDEDIKDIDLVVEGPTMNQIKLTLEPYGRVSIEGDSFAVIKFRPKGHEGEDFDIAVPRRDKKIGKGHKGFVVETNDVDIEEDLQRRDFTINAIAVNIETGELLDPFDGFTDIELGVLRAVDETAFVEDPLRILRGIQFAARFSYHIDVHTLKLMRDNANLLKQIKGERILDEFMKILKKYGDTQYAFDLLHETGLDKALFGKKMLHYDDGLDHLDTISFFYVLGLLGDVNPGDFVKKRLKAKNELEKNVRTVDNIFTLLPNVTEEEDLKFMLFKAFNYAPGAMDAVILPDAVEEIVVKMRTLEIPHGWDDIAIGGDDVKELGNLSEGPEVGLIKEKILRDALMNRFNWADRKDSLEYLENLLS